MLRRRCRLSIVLLLLVGGGPALAQTLDRFYLDLLQTGAQELDRGDGAAAARDLRIACFGLLASPPTLAGCLVRLGLAQAALGDEAAFNDSFRRLAEVEERFAGWSKAEIPQALRERYADEALRRVKDARLRSLPAFATLLEQRQDAELARLPVRERRKALEARITADPAGRRWRLALALLELDDQRPKAALRPLETLLKGTPDDAQALCLRGRAQAALDDCAAALPDLRACPLTVPSATAARLGCLLGEHQEATARELVATLPPATRADPAVAKLLARLPASPAPAARPPVLAAPTPRPVTTPPADPPTQRSSFPAATPAELEAIHRQLDSARTTAELDTAWQAAARLADRYPISADAQFLAAEVAYRQRHWADAGRYFQRGGDPGDRRPLLLFYAAVVAHETGDVARAEANLRRALPLIQRTPYVELYVQKILHSPSGP